MGMKEIVFRLIGPIRPVGETKEDARRMENLKEFIDLVDIMLGQIDEVAKNADRNEASMRKAGEYAKDFLEGLRDES